MVKLADYASAAQQRAKWRGRYPAAFTLNRGGTISKALTAARPPGIIRTVA
ncbi:hypothetical protein KIN20_005066 [Parelaphostrongylus tenuis]|uniref:Uncharacterized protein n=1 Tax=Parelaphostrongylus tenuis TaxID=148309 RepID=A0AAD5M401_PARTN|nr:hypothetical protein KIN20_005066 [Parelaphostrongylus tenuis]